MSKCYIIIKAPVTKELLEFLAKNAEVKTELTKEEISEYEKKGYLMVNV